MLFEDRCAKCEFPVPTNLFKTTMLIVYLSKALIPALFNDVCIFCVFLRSMPCCFGSWSFAMYKGLSMLIVERATHLGQLEYYLFILKEQFLFVCISSIREQMSQEHFYFSYVLMEWCICTKV
jgi:hypothetical protein